jgi:pimeloyl-CoA synthetase
MIKKYLFEITTTTHYEGHFQKIQTVLFECMSNCLGRDKVNEHLRVIEADLRWKDDPDYLTSNNKSKYSYSHSVKLIAEQGSHYPS